MTRLAHSGQSNRTRECPLSGSGHRTELSPCPLRPKADVPVILTPVAPPLRRQCSMEKAYRAKACYTPSRHNPKILWIDDAEIVGDRITEVRPIPGNCFTQETERRIGELGASCVAFIVRDVSVHEAP